ncbi:uncharacterized protein EV422DRAFT_34171 [Fimicolochytrium jonesii]|uniref:uncharacterized protein n=1 Tax=Fimicolochytrium jonesii TaxID=1396493 RepID=UPI0022FDF40A|nr:uncharacterized protein EV422DRAFT_34171 [Fimicolochytrium jonesii]KAI8827276.1 hypothetical protein EV422DRAFT_34171 [Fimicolochytrium jonesii]
MSDVPIERAIPTLRVSTAGSAASSIRGGAYTPRRSDSSTPDPLLSALSSAGGSRSDLYDDYTMTPGSMTPRSKERYDLKRANLIRELNEHDQKMEHTSLDWKLRKEIYLKRLKKEDALFEKIRARRVKIERDTVRREQQDLERREKEVHSARNSRAASRIGSTQPSRSGSIHEQPGILSPSPLSAAPLTAGVQRSLAGLQRHSRPYLGGGSSSPLSQYGSRTFFHETGIKESEQAAEDLRSFQDERRMRKLARQKAEEEVKRRQAAIAEQLAKEIEEEFAGDHAEDDVQPSIEAPHRSVLPKDNWMEESRPLAGKDNPTKLSQELRGRGFQPQPPPSTAPRERSPRKKDIRELDSECRNLCMETESSETELSAGQAPPTPSLPPTNTAEASHPETRTESVQADISHNLQKPHQAASAYPDEVSQPIRNDRETYPTREESSTSSLRSSMVEIPPDAVKAADVSPSMIFGSTEEVPAHLESSPPASDAPHSILPEETSHLSDGVPPLDADVTALDASPLGLDKFPSLEVLSSVGAMEMPPLRTGTVPGLTALEAHWEAVDSARTERDEGASAREGLTDISQTEGRSSDDHVDFALDAAVESEPQMKDTDDQKSRPTDRGDMTDASRRESIPSSERVPKPIEGVALGYHSSSEMEVETDGPMQTAETFAESELQKAGPSNEQDASANPIQPTSPTEDRENATSEGIIPSEPIVETASHEPQEHAGEELADRSPETQTDEFSQSPGTEDSKTVESEAPTPALPPAESTTKTSVAHSIERNAPRLTVRLRVKVPNRPPSANHLKKRGTEKGSMPGQVGHVDVQPIPQNDTPTTAMSFTTPRYDMGKEDADERTHPALTAGANNVPQIAVNTPAPPSPVRSSSREASSPISQSATTATSATAPEIPERNISNNSAWGIASASSVQLKRVSTLPETISAPTLYLVKGKRKIYVTRLPTVRADALNHGDVFILVMPRLQQATIGGVQGTIYMWKGKDSGKVKRAKAKEVALKLLDKDWIRKAELVDLDENSDGAQWTAFWEALGCANGVAPVGILDAKEGGDDAEHERSIDERTHLFGWNENGSALEEIPVSKPLSFKSIQSGHCHVLDCFNDIYVWIGRGSRDEDACKMQAYAQSLTNQAGRPADVKVFTEREAVERTLFRERFIDWPEKDVSLEVRKQTNVVAKDKSRYVYDRGGTDVKKKDSIDVLRMLLPPPPPANEKTPLEDDPGGPAKAQFDRGRLEMKVWVAKIDDPAQNELLSSAEEGVFFSDESYLLLYRHKTGREGNEKEAAIAYYWIGSGCRSTDQGAVAYMATDLEKKYNAKLIRAPEGQEPEHLLSIFPTMVVRRGIRSAGHLWGERSLFHIRGVSKKIIRVAENVWAPSSLNSADSFVILSKDKIFVWHGLGSFSFTKEYARKVAERIQVSLHLKPSAISETQEGQENKSLNKVLPGADAAVKQSSPAYLRTVKSSLEGIYTTRLFRISHLVHGNPTAEEFDPYVPTDLQQTGLFIIDAFFEVFLWIGAEARTNFRDVKLALETALEYAEVAGQRQPQRALTAEKVWVVGPGSEPAGFKAAFCAFDAYMEDEGQQDTSAAAAQTKGGFLNKLRRKNKTNELWKRPASPEKGNSPTADGGAATTTVESASALLQRFNTATYSMEVLKQKDHLPFGVDPMRVETYLSTQDFVKHFNIDRDTFSSYPAWKQTDLKKKAGLF